MSTWQPMETAPRDGTTFVGRARYQEGGVGHYRLVRRTRWGKVAHVPIYGWTWCPGRDPEQCDIWEPQDWRPL
jgi:hypothetical protein